MELGFTDSTVLILRVHDGEIRLTEHGLALQRSQQILAKYKKPGVSMVDELLRERREEAARE